MKHALLPAILVALFSSGASAQITGIAVSSMSRVDAYVEGFMGTYSIDGGAVAITKDGRLVYNRAFGFANQSGTDTAQPYNRFRIASVSKPLTSIAIMKMMQDGVLALDEYAFGHRGGILTDSFYLNAIALKDSIIYKITVRHLLEHTAGWDRDKACGTHPTCDPISFPLDVAAATGTGNPAGDSAMIRFLLQQGLVDSPGTHYAYSNIGYLILGKIIEARTGVKYEKYMDSVIFKPLGLCDMALSKNLLADKQERESEYNNTSTSKSCYGTGVTVPDQYGGLNIEAMNAHGGWISTAEELTRLIVAVDGYTSVPDILSAASLDTMTKPSVRNTFYGKGWQVNPSHNWWHTGSLPGTATFICRTSGGVTWAFLFNERKGGSFFSDLDALPWDALTGVTYPAHDLFPPETNVGGLTAAKAGTTSATLSWTKGSGDRRMILATEDAAFTKYPADGLSYTASAAFGSGQALKAGTYVVYNDSTGSSMTVTGLDATKTYQFTAYEYYSNTKTGGVPVYKIGCHPGASLNMNATGIVNNPSQENAFIYPNPVGGYCLLVTGKSTLNTMASLKDITGREMREIRITGMKQQIDLSTLVPGMYFLHLTNGTVLKLMKN